MEVVKSINDFNKFKEISFGITIGNFDGVHMGHQQAICEMLETCFARGLKLVLITFRPHPRFVLHSKKRFMLNNYDDRRILLKKNKVKLLWEIDFTKDFGMLTPEVFLDRYIFNLKNLKTIFLGNDFAFGKNRSGGKEVITHYCKKSNIMFEPIKEFKRNEQLCSSTLIRESLHLGNIQDANRLLGRQFFFRGVIVRGRGLGKKIGFPTINTWVDEEIVIPHSGVYATQTECQGRLYRSVTNIGVNPTSNENSNKTLQVETHILDFNKDIYGETVSIAFVKKLRDEKKFNGLKELALQIKKDICIREQIH